ncbi:MAG: hypothetical protein V1768_00760 [Patescibacteria group bacterium]|nr:hypothetical protein [Patescibacteria group bacterium]MBU1683936.1 hypothetical protein [Patescibacteria group bacterium]
MQKKLYYTKDDIQQRAKKLYKQITEEEGYTNIGALLGIAYYFLEEIINFSKERESKLLKAYFKKYASLLSQRFELKDVTECAGLMVDIASDKVNNKKGGESCL